LYRYKEKQTPGERENRKGRDWKNPLAGRERKVTDKLVAGTSI